MVPNISRARVRTSVLLAKTFFADTQICHAGAGRARSRAYRVEINKILMPRFWYELNIKGFLINDFIVAVRL